MKGFEERVQAYGASVKAGEKIPPPEPAISAERHSRLPRFLWTWVAIVSLTLVAGSLAWWQPWKPESEAVSDDRMVFPLPDKPSIAVLPFDNMSGDPEQEYFVDGMTEDLITDLSKVSGLFVIARHSTFAYKETSPDVRQVANELGVRYVLEGSMRRSGNSIRINAQLIDATTGGHMWAERYDGTLDNVFALQDRVTEKIVSALAINLTAEEQSVRATGETDNPVAYDAYLQGMEFYRRFTPNDFAEAISHFQRATRLDPNYGRAYAALASVYWESVRQGESWIREFAENVDSRESSMAVARSRSDDYLRLAKKNPSPLYYYLLSAKRWDYRQFADAIADAERGIALDPNDPDGYVALAWALIFDGRPREALAAVERAMRLDPRRPEAYRLVLGMIQFGWGHYESAATALREAHEGNLRNRNLNVPLAAAYTKSGRLDDARNALKRYTDAESSSTTNVGLLMSWWPFKREADIRRFGGSLVEAGLCCEKYLEGYIERARRGGTLQ